MNRLFILDPGLRKRSGHNYQMAVGISAGMAAKGITCRVATHKDAAQDVGSELEVSGIFSQSHYAYLSEDPFSGLLEDYFAGARRMATEMKHVGRSGLDDDDLFFLPTAGPRELLALAIFLQEKKVRPRVAALFHRTEPPGTSLGAGSVTAAIHRHAGKSLLGSTEKSRVLMAATTEYLAQRLAVPLGIAVGTMPVPVWYPLPCVTADVARKEGDGPVIAFVGHMKDNHGFDTIPALARELRVRWPQAKVRIHLGAVGPRFDLSGYRALAQEGVADVIEGWLDDAQMAALYCSADVLVMPYDRVAYREMVSAVLCTAIALGKPAVVPSDSWLADQVEAGRGCGAVYSDDGIAHIADAVGSVLKDMDGFNSRAAACAGPWRRNHSGEALVEHLFGWYRGITPATSVDRSSA